MRYIFTLLLLTIVLFANNAEVLKRADANSRSSEKSEIIRAYNDYRNIYIRALMKDDDKLCKTCLTGLIQTGKKLHIDVFEYEVKLKKLKSKKTTKAKKRQPKKLMYKKTVPIGIV